jgi:hypothetical protein
VKLIHLQKTVTRDSVIAASNTRNHGPGEFDSDDIIVICRALLAARESAVTSSPHERHALDRMLALLGSP